MEWKQIPLGPLQTNCYLLLNNDNCLVIDPGEEGDKLIGIIESLHVKPQGILLTHAHFDHIGAVDVIRDHYQIPVYVHEKEAKWLLDPALNGSQFFSVGHLVRIKPADVFLTEEKIHTIGDFSFRVYETPGHSPGSISVYFEQDKLVLAGDALFNGSIGRTDLSGGNYQELINSIHDKLLGLPEETIVLSGHGPNTTIGKEMDSNPFLNGF
ncbi:MBL fold metallo-hydrolase [Bacillus sp. DNRA2]|uniref:MBL fold metallo-hydrolase n=1 Tax=Bacillus sp. DNRA2 TaxID=2723053 RepID=UPI00145DF93A|nr:MBL fold metallo-hydrolase [Bacillus sp. DNRA2]NMD71837.1 MBL fold metallo-hydrolase [Bacillus sp. DNRA2]